MNEYQNEKLNEISREIANSIEKKKNIIISLKEDIYKAEFCQHLIHRALNHNNPNNEED